MRVIIDACQTDSQPDETLSLVTLLESPLSISEQENVAAQLRALVGDDLCAFLSVLTSAALFAAPLLITRDENSLGEFAEEVLRRALKSVPDFNRLRGDAHHPVPPGDAAAYLGFVAVDEHMISYGALGTFLEGELTELLSFSLDGATDLGRCIPRALTLTVAGKTSMIGLLLDANSVGVMTIDTHPYTVKGGDGGAALFADCAELPLDADGVAAVITLLALAIASDVQARFPSAAARAAEVQVGGWMAGWLGDWVSG